MPKIYDVIVIGDGPVGLHAAASCAHFNLAVLVIGRERCIDRGKERKGRCHYAREIFNHPDFEKVSGEELIERNRKKLQNEMYRSLV
ncbi:hypothetical protein HYU10_04885, partial [Candidatus Woesearchaeota archaeon]|nr:hypothetical protein [Candidatus Woesearchaeota archaeon]